MQACRHLAYVLPHPENITHRHKLRGRGEEAVTP
jgi:hypothetical protein